MKKNGQTKNFHKIVWTSLAVLISASLTCMVSGQENQEKVYEEVAVMPKFQDSDINTFRTWVMQNVKYPDAAKKEGVSGKVWAEFIVEKDGTIKEAKIKESVAESLDKEVIRVIKSSPKWSPGKNKDGEIVRVRFAIAVMFALK